MHAFMALFFYELVRDQIVFIWHAWAIAVGPQMIIVPVCRTMPSVLLWWWRRRRKRKEKKDKSAPIDQAMSNWFLIICVYIFIYLIIYWRVLRRERRSRHGSLLQALRRVDTSQNSDWAQRHRLVSFSLVSSFSFSSCRWFWRQNAVKLKPDVHVQLVEIDADLFPGGGFVVVVEMLFMQHQLEPLGYILKRV